jgi:hypothetical protein
MTPWRVLVGVTLLAGTAVVWGATASGKRTAAPSTRPDWSGLWEVVGVTPDATGETVESDEELTARFFAHPPYNREWEAHFQAALKQSQSREERATCTWGVPMLMLESPLMFEVLITPKETAMIFSGREIREIYTDGRGHLTAEKIFPTHWGDSIGHWEGATLVIDTIAVDSPTIFTWGRGGGRLMGIFSDRVHYHERVKMIAKDLLEDELSIVDPIALTAPWKLTHQYHRITSIDRMIHEDCEGNDRNPVVNGKFTIK